MNLQPGLLSQVVIFQGANFQELARFLEGCAVLEAGAEHVLLDPNRPSSDMYVVLSGVLEVYLDDATRERLKTITQGGSVGEMSLMRRLLPSAYVVTQTPSRLLAIDETHFWAILEHFPVVAFNLMKMLSDWLADNNTLLIDRQSRLAKRTQELAWEHAKLEKMVHLGISLSGERDETAL
ncbi:MAG: cyclic nucleotide-binding domain-containing protein, partial [Magnetococcales bacterium]|nr:cyclic nucleotide-binding domain-containing protein [Magnetococcales bacterium]